MVGGRGALAEAARNTGRCSCRVSLAGMLCEWPWAAQGEIKELLPVCFVRPGFRIFVHVYI